MRSTGAGICALTLTMAGASPVVAQMPAITPERQPIAAPLDRPSLVDDDEKKSLEPVGARLGVMTIFPRLEGAVTYNDNVYALEDKTDDTIFRVSPSVRVVGKADPYTFNLNAGLDRIEFDKNNRESRTDWRIGFDNRYEFMPETYASGFARFSREHEDRGNPNALTTNLSPTKYNRGELGGELSRNVARLGGNINFGVIDYNYYNARQIGGGVTNNDDRDHKEYNLAATTLFEFSRGYSAVLRGTYAKVKYDDRFDDNGIRRDNDGYTLNAGIKLELTRLLTGTVTAGYLWRNYTDPLSRDFRRATFNAELNWYPNELTSVRVTADRIPQETVAPGYSGFFSNVYSLRIEHELRRTIKLVTAGRLIDNDYLRDSSGLVPKRGEKFYIGSLGVNYTLNRNFFAGLAYEYTKKTSTATTPGSTFKRNRFSFNVGARF